MKEKAARILKRIKTQEFMLLNLRLIDIYQGLGVNSKMLQKVEQFPWEISRIQQNLVNTLRKRAEIKLANEVGNPIEGKLDGELWPSLKNYLDSVLVVCIKASRLVYLCCKEEEDQLMT